jgi:hypothetical protein
MNLYSIPARRYAVSILQIIVDGSNLIYGKVARIFERKDCGFFPNARFARLDPGVKSSFQFAYFFFPSFFPERCLLR